VHTRIQGRLSHCIHRFCVVGNISHTGELFDDDISHGAGNERLPRIHHMWRTDRFPNGICANDKPPQTAALHWQYDDRIDDWRPVALACDNFEYDDRSWADRIARMVRTGSVFHALSALEKNEVAGIGNVANIDLGTLQTFRFMHNPLRKIVIAGGSGFVGKALAGHFSKTSEVVILSRTASPQSGNIRTVKWNGRDLDDWAKEIDGCFALINLTGKNVNCRYTPANRKEILESRTLSTKILGDAVSRSMIPPKVWIQMSSATIYRHSLDKPMDEKFGETGSDFSMDVVKAWEKIFNELDLPQTRTTIMRTSIVLGKDGGAFQPLRNLVKCGLGGRQGSGKQMVSWIHINDVVGVVDWMLDNPVKGEFNVTAPQPVTNSHLMKSFRKAYHVPIGLPAPEWLLTFGARLIGTETELVLKSRWVVPKRLLQEGYRFRFTSIDSAINDLVK